MNKLIVTPKNTSVNLRTDHRFTAGCPHHNTRDMGEGWVWCMDCGAYWKAEAARSILVTGGSRFLVMEVL